MKNHNGGTSYSKKNIYQNNFFPVLFLFFFRNNYDFFIVIILFEFCTYHLNHVCYVRISMGDMSQK